MTTAFLSRPDPEDETRMYTIWRGSSHSDDEEIIRRNMTRAYMDRKKFTREFLGFRLASDEEREP